MKLENISRNLPYKAPDGYFDDLPMRVQARVNHSDEKLFSVSWSWRRSVMAAAASVVIGVLVWATYPEKQTSLGSDALSQVTDEAVLDYVKQNPVSSQDIEENLANNSVNNESVIQNLEVSDQDILDELKDVSQEEI